MAVYSAKNFLFKLTPFRKLPSGSMLYSAVVLTANGVPNMHLLTSGTACQLSGLTPKQINDWTNKQIITPHQGGKTQGDYRLWTPMQVVGLIVANEVRNSERGCVLSYVGKVVEAFGNVTESWLEKELSEGNTHLVMIHHDKPLLRGKEYQWADVQAAYKKVQQAVKELEHA